MTDDAVVLHGLRGCDTCRKAAAELRAAGVAVRLRDLRDDPPGDGEVARWIAVMGPEVLNRRSATWRGLPEGERARPPGALLAAHPALVKRPVVELADGRLFLGPGPASRAARLP